MGRLKEPVDLIIAKGRTRLGADEEERRRSEEVKVPFTRIEAPDYLTEEQKKKFDYLAQMLLALRIFTELDVDCLGRYIIAHDLYIGYTKVLRRTLMMGDPDDIQKVQNMQSKVFQQAQSSARDLGLTVTSRCRIVIPPPADDEDDDL